jgi:hypothetical protein
VSVPVRTGRLIRAVVVACVAFEVLLVLLDYHVNYGGRTTLGTLRRMTNITREDSLASWFGTTQTTLVALVVWLIWLTVRHGEATRGRRIGWLVLALFFSFMAVDDGAMLHERAGTVFDDLHSDDAEGGPATATGARMREVFPSYGWQIVALPLFVAFGAFMLAFLWRELGAGGPRALVLVALACFALAVGLDFVEGLRPEHPWNLYTRVAARFDLETYTQYRFGQEAYDALRHFSKSIEEFLEMFGNTLLACLFLRRLAATAPDLRFRFDEGVRPRRGV